MHLQMKTSLQLKLSQHLTLTPQLQQSIKLLQLSTVELNQELERYLADNPLLERADLADDAPFVPGANSNQAEYASSGEAPAGNESREHDSDFGFSEGGGSGHVSRRDNDDGDDNGEYAQIPAAEPSLQEHLLSQLALTSITELDRKLAMTVIAHLDEDGYLTYDLDDLRTMLGEHGLEAEPEEIQIAVKRVQNLEPTGVGARSLSECLMLQLRALPADTPQRDNAMQLVENHLDVLAARDFARLKRLFRCSDDELKQMRELIISQDPKPGRCFDQSDTRYVVADVFVRKVHGKWQAALNQEAMPKLRVNRMYADLLQKSRDANGKNLAGQLQEARWLIKNVQQRFDTILRVTQAIVERQKHFFDHGEVAMRPLVLREIADQVGLHESTVSRVTTQKYMLTPRGLYELKYFFGSGVSTDSGGACSSTAIRALIRQLVEAEDQKKPLSDNRISDILSQQGILVARRTVAKYREALAIQPASMRKSL
jgi:RNA polymerase sigma-54 factor